RFPEPFKKAQVCAHRLAPLVASHYESLWSNTRVDCGEIDCVCSSPAETLWPVRRVSELDVHSGKIVITPAQTCPSDRAGGSARAAPRHRIPWRRARGPRRL